eukprot:SAG31_NODE_2203_length_6199_cov_6.619836_2_plen_108_part_00
MSASFKFKFEFEFKFNCFILIGPPRMVRLSRIASSHLTHRIASQLEIMDPALIQAGIQLTHDLDARFGLAAKRTLSQRDVPGMTRSIIPIIREMGVDSITVGANDGS